MFDFHEKRKIRSLLYSKFSIGVLLILIILLSISTYKRYTVEREMLQKTNEKQAELDALNERASVLSSKVDRLKDDRGVEEELRSRFDVAKEGEQVVVLVDGKHNSSTDLESLSQPPGGKSTKSGFSPLRFLKFW